MAVRVVAFSENEVLIDSCPQLSQPENVDIFLNQPLWPHSPTTKGSPGQGGEGPSNRWQGQSLKNEEA